MKVGVLMWDSEKEIYIDFSFYHCRYTLAKYHLYYFSAVVLLWNSFFILSTKYNQFRKMYSFLWWETI